MSSEEPLPPAHALLDEPAVVAGADHCSSLPLNTAGQAGRTTTAVCHHSTLQARQNNCSGGDRSLTLSGVSQCQHRLNSHLQN